jgi:hypothetical protein
LLVISPATRMGIIDSDFVKQQAVDCCSEEKGNHSKGNLKLSTLRPGTWCGHAMTYGPVSASTRNAIPTSILGSSSIALKTLFVT